MTREEQRAEIQKYLKSSKGKRTYEKIEKQLGRKLSFAERQLIAIDLLSCIEIDTGKVKELQELGVEV